MQVATGIRTAGYDDAERHLMRVQRGSGTLFENEEQREVIQAFTQQEGKERAEDMGVPYEPELSQFGSLSEKDQAKMLKEWVGGQYVFPKPAEVGDVLGHVARYARKNETYLPDDTRKFQEKLKSLLPASATQNRTAPKPRTGLTRNPL
jgi:NTP pyrophosphatase (non-canonical NTP hydrolase)